MRYFVVTDGTNFGSLEAGKPMPYGFHCVGCAHGYDTKEACQEWVWEHLEGLELLEQSYDGKL